MERPMNLSAGVCVGGGLGGRGVTLPCRAIPDIFATIRNITYRMISVIFMEYSTPLCHYAHIKGREEEEGSAEKKKKHTHTHTHTQTHTRCQPQIVLDEVLHRLSGQWGNLGVGSRMRPSVAVTFNSQHSNHHQPLSPPATVPITWLNDARAGTTTAV